MKTDWPKFGDLVTLLGQEDWVAMFVAPSRGGMRLITIEPGGFLRGSSAEYYTDGGLFQWWCEDGFEESGWKLYPG